jgi:hypothetical protein
VTFDLDAMRNDSSTLALIPIFLVALVVVRGIPAVVYRPLAGARGALVAGMLQATSLPFIVTATMVGVEIDALTPATAAAFVAAGLVAGAGTLPTATSSRSSRTISTTPCPHAFAPQSMIT